MTFASANDARDLPATSLSRHGRLTHTGPVVLLALAIALFSAPPARAQDFGGYRPGYQGYGVNTPGGRGGAILRVTHLHDTWQTASPFWEGSLRKALLTPGPRFILFEVSGTIDLIAPLVVTSPYLTIAGQTAPSPGILIRNSYLQIDTHDVVVQHLRIRPGAVRGEPHGVWIRSNANNIVLDHVSVSWTVWTSIDAFAPPSPAVGVGDVAIIDSIVAEALGCSGVNTLIPCEPATYPNSGMPNSKAFLFGDDNDDPTYNNGRQRIAMIRNLSANNNDRQPAIQGDVDLFYINNLTYNPSQSPWSGIFWTAGFNLGPSMTVAKGNLMIAGPTTPGNNGYVAPFFAADGEMYWGRVVQANPQTRIYLDGNYYVKHCPANACLVSSSAQWMLVKDYMWPQGISVRALSPPLSLTNLPLDSVMPYTQVENYVLANAGARPLDRDAVDARIVENVRTRTGRAINTPDDVGGYPFLAENWRSLTVPANASQVVDGVGRTAIERWLEGMARALEPSGGAGAPSPEGAPTGATRIPQTNWRLHFADSQETVGEPGAASNAFDGRPNTHWHTQWYNATAPVPHEIQIDLGATYAVSGFQHLPRASGINGRIIGYEFYVSTDGLTWGAPVSGGSLANVATEQEVRFAAKAGRYIRLRALSSVQGTAWTSLGELNVLAEQ